MPVDPHPGLQAALAPLLAPLLALLRQGPITVLTGAGLSTGSGIPAYRDAQGQWQHPPPTQHQAFVRDASVRQRYWARSFVGWQRFGQAAPNAGHAALAALEAAGHIHTLITQNVDGLHQRAGSARVIELHGSLGQVRCLGCQALWPRAQLQGWLSELNVHKLAADPAHGAEARTAPDGDAHLADDAHADFVVPACPACGGVLKPDVVFFGDNVPRERVAQAAQAVADSAGLLVVGSSLMVYSGYRFAEQAHKLGKPLVSLNQGVTRADPILSAKVEADCGEALAACVAACATALSATAGLKAPAG
jgi:NAD-dependent SIR2 family protein deacetylase